MGDEITKMISREEADMWLDIGKGTDEAYQEFLKLQELDERMVNLEQVEGVFVTQSSKQHTVIEGVSYLKYLNVDIKNSDDINDDIMLTQQGLKKVYNRIKNRASNLVDNVSASISKTFHKVIKDVHDGSILIDGLIREVKKAKIGDYNPNITRDQAKWSRYAWLYLSLGNKFYESPKVKLDTNKLVKAAETDINAFNMLGDKDAFGLAGKGVDANVLKMINDKDIDISVKDHKLINSNKESTVITYLGTNSTGYVFHIEGKRLKISKVSFKATSEYKEKIIAEDLSKLKRKIQVTIDEFTELNNRSKKYEKDIEARMKENHTDSQVLIDDMDDNMYPLITMIKQVRLETILGDHKRLQEDLTYVPMLLMHQINNADGLLKPVVKTLVHDIKATYNKVVKIPQIVKG